MSKVTSTATRPISMTVDGVMALPPPGRPR